MTIQSYKDLMVWQNAMDIIESVYRLTAAFPKEETYGLTSQLRRAAVSIASNIAEGHNRDSLKEYIHFLSIAQGSLAELETQIMLAIRLKYPSEEQMQTLLTQTDKLGKMLRSLQQSLKNKIPNLKLVKPRT